MANYLKPQTPLNIKDDYFYPLTYDDQVILSDGRRLSEIDFDRTDLVFVGSSEDFPDIGDSGKLYVRDGYIYFWTGDNYIALSVQSVNNKTGIVELDASDVGALAYPTTTDNLAEGSYLIVKSITNGRIEVGFASLEDQTGGFIEFTEDEEIAVSSRQVNTLYGLKLREVDESGNTTVTYSDG